MPYICRRTEIKKNKKNLYQTTISKTKKATTNRKSIKLIDLLCLDGMQGTSSTEQIFFFIFVCSSFLCLDIDKKSHRTKFSIKLSTAENEKNLIKSRLIKLINTS